MKSFQKFCLLAIFPVLLLSVISIISSGGSFKDTQIARVNITLIGFFSIISFGYIYVFKKRQQKKESNIKNFLIAALFVFVAVFCFASLNHLLFFGATSFDTLFFQTSISQSLFCVCIFFVSLLIFLLINHCSTTNELVLDERKIFYVKLVLGISLFEFLIGSMLMLLSYPLIILLKLIIPFLFICLSIPTVVFLLILGMNSFIFFKKKYLLSTFIAFYCLFIAFLLPFLIVVPFDTRIIFLIPVVSLFATLSIVVTLLYRSKQRMTTFKLKSLTNSVSKKEAEYLQLKQQVNPHFLFNNLNTLISFIEIDPKKAIEFGHHLSNTYRHYLKNKNDDFVSLKEELEFIKEYLEIYKAKFENSFSFEITVQPKENEYIVCLSLQEMVDNVFKHNTMDENNPLQIWIYSVENGLHIENSISKKANEEISQRGLENINKRYEILANKQIQIINNTNTYQVILPILELEA